MDSGWDTMDCVTSACREELEHFRMVGLSNFFSPLFAIFRFVSEFVGSPSLSPWRRRRFWGVSCGWDMMDYGSAFGSRENFEYAEKLGTFQMRTAPPLLLLESLRELREFGRRTGLVGYLRRYLLSCRSLWALPVSSSPSLPTLSFCPFARLVSLGLWWDFLWLGHDGLRKRSQHHVFFCVHRRSRTWV